MPAPPKPPSTEPAIRVVMMPRETNAQGTIFGGVILSLIDQAAYVEANRQAHHLYVTVAMNAVEFRLGVFSGKTVVANAVESKTVIPGRAGKVD